MSREHLRKGYGPGSTHFSILIGGKADELMLDFEKLLDLTTASVASMIAQAGIADDIAIGVFMYALLTCAVSYRFRIIEALRTYPLKLLLLVLEPPSVPSRRRAEICKELRANKEGR